MIAVRATLIGIALLLIFSSESRAQDGTLTGESFVGIEFQFEGTCDPFGVSKYTWSTMGTALGPYPGTFQERGTITIDATGGVPVVVAWESSFRIDSPTTETTVTGTKSLLAGTPPACSEIMDVETLFFVLSATYEARINGPAGVLNDSGVSPTVMFQGLREGGITTGTFFEDFLSSRTTDGFVSAGGQTINIPGEPGVTFGLTALITGREDHHASGVFVDKLLGVTVRLLDATVVVVSETDAHVFGTAEVNGVRQNYRLDLIDSGEPNNESDFVAIATGCTSSPPAGQTTGDCIPYAHSGPVTHGNVQIHNRQQQ